MTQPLAESVKDLAKPLVEALEVITERKCPECAGAGHPRPISESNIGELNNITGQAHLIALPPELIKCKTCNGSGKVRWKCGEIVREDRQMPKIVCLCGSTRFMQEFFEAGWDFTLRGYIVLSVGVCKHAKHHGAEALGKDVVDRLDELHLRKIDLADEVFVINKDGYIGKSTKREIEYAKIKGKPIDYLVTERTKC